MLIAALSLSATTIMLLLFVAAWIFLLPYVSNGVETDKSLPNGLSRGYAGFAPGVALDPQVAAHRDLSAVAKHLEGRSLGVEAGPHLDALAALISRRGP